MHPYFSLQGRTALRKASSNSLPTSKLRSIDWISW